MIETRSRGGRGGYQG